ncbi:MAG: DUF1501 domain-containing protein [Gemmataceae bacterium]|nr:DUF1501 domain-containing protein [Gemmataceae bacterium]
MQRIGCHTWRDGYPTRRQVVQAAVWAAGAGSWMTGQIALAPAAEPASPPRPRAQAVILLFMWGGPSHLDTLDPKPLAPAEIRGEFQPIRTTVPGIQISEHFPRLARLAHLYTIIRSMGHDDPAHLSPVHHLMTGHVAPTPKSDAAPATRQDHPHFGAMLAKLRPAPAGVPTCVVLPWLVSHPAAPGGTAPGQHAGWLGSAYDPFVITADPNHPDFRIAGLDSAEPRLLTRQQLLEALDRHPAAAAYPPLRDKALALLTSRRLAQACDLNREPVAIRDRYGRHTFGQSCLLARRLIEAGVPFVCVHWPNDGAFFWDTHGDNFRSLKHRLMPPADQGTAALLEDLHARGLLSQTLVVWTGEFGRTPKITPGNAGREHWPFCYSALVAGAGICGGILHGASDKIGAYPTTPPVSPADLTATIAFALGLNPQLEIHDRLHRPLPLTRGQPLTTLFA